MAKSSSHDGVAVYPSSGPPPTPAPATSRRLSRSQEDYLKRHSEWLAEHRDDDGRRDTSIVPTDWSGAGLANRDLSRAVLIDVDFGGADLSGANLGASDLSNADLSRANLTGATLSKAVFRGASLKDARGIDALQLSSDSLGGVDFRGTGITPLGQWDEGLKGVEEVSKYIQGLYKILLAICGFGMLTVVSFRDEQLLDHGGTSMTPLPLFQAAISPSMFVIVVPVFTLLLYVYLLIYVFALWRELSYLPAYFPDGAALDRKAYPMLLSSYVRVHFKRLEEGPPGWFQMLLASLMEFGVPTAATFTFWAICLRKHDVPTSVVEGFVFAATAGLSVSFFVMARPLLRQEDWEDWSPVPWLSREWLQGLSKAARHSRVATLATAYRVAAILLFAGSIPIFMVSRPEWRGPLASSLPFAWCIAWGVAIGVYFHRGRFRVAVLLSWAYALPIGLTLWIASMEVFASGNDTIRGVPDYQRAGPIHLLRTFGINPFLDLTGKVISSKPSGLSGKPELESDELDLVVGPDLEGADLRSLDANRVYLVRANLRDAKLDYANLRNANLRGADLRGASFRGAILRNASLRDAWLQGAHLGGALLRGEDPREPIRQGNVDLQGARLADVDCTPAELKQARNYELAYYGVRDGAGSSGMATGGNEKAIGVMQALGIEARADEKLWLKEFGGYKFKSADLRGADFTRFNLKGAVFREGSWLRDAVFCDADLRGANLVGADLRGADFRGAKLEGVELKDASVLGADFSGTDLEHVTSLTEDQFYSAKVDKETKPPHAFEGAKD